MTGILLVGYPNVGKSVLFSRLTGARAIASNYPGTTVEFTRGKLRLGANWAEVSDAPGTYSLEPLTKAEEVVTDMLTESDVVVNVVDATNLERNLHLTLALLKSGKPVVVALNMFDETKRKGVHIEVEELQALLGVPVVATCALSGEGIKALVSRLGEATANTFPHEDDARWQHIGEIIQRVQKITHHRRTLLESFADLSLRPWSGLVLAAFVAVGSFEAIRFIGEGLIGYVFEPLFETCWSPVIMRLSDLIGQPSHLHDILIGKLADGGVDYVESMGLLTTGLFVPFGMVLPYVFPFYLVLSILEDIGYLPRVAVLMDTIMHRLGLHGLVIVPVLLGLGCNVCGTLATRIAETRRQRFISATLVSVSVPCMAQIAMILGLLGGFGATGLTVVFGTLMLQWIALALVLKVVIPGESPEMFLEIPPYRMLSWRALAQKVWLRIGQFGREAIPFVLLGVLIANLLYSLRVIDVLGAVAAPVTTNVLGLPRDTVGALLIGFLRKDVAVGMLAPMGLSMKQLAVACVVLASYFPCVATFAVFLREFGARDTAKATGIMVLVALLTGGILNMVM
jgi:ferrous iron transport protein B